jgi:HAD superfamily hydrolase (TIGR01549 family)
LLFDLHGTLAHVEKPIDEAKVSRLLVNHGYDVYPQAYHAAWHFVSMVDYPRHGYTTYEAFLRQVLKRCGHEIDGDTLKELGMMYRRVKWQLYSDAPRALKLAKSAGYKTGVITTIARFLTETVLRPIVGEIDLHVDGFTYGCEKSNPRIYTKAMEDLDVRASETLMVGDELELDVVLPKRLGMSALLLDRKRKYGASVTQPDGVVRDLVEAVNFADSLRM